MINEEILEKLWKENLKALKKEKWEPASIIRKILYKIGFAEVMFNFFEKYLEPCVSNGSEVVVAEKLTTQSLKKLIEKNEICAIHVPGFCPHDVAESLSKKAMEEYTNWKLQGVVSTDMFYAGGSLPKEVAKHSWPAFRRYFLEKEIFLHEQRTTSDGQWPVDRLRSELNDKWPSGTKLGKYLGHELRPAIMRIMNEESDFDFSVPDHGFIHTDDNPNLKESEGTFSANIYLKVSEEGGDLYIWSVNNLKTVKGFRNRLSAWVVIKLLTLIVPDGHIFSERWQQKIIGLLPKPHVIKPKAGDLVILHSGLPHAVSPVTKGVRVTNQLFIRAMEGSSLIIHS